MEGLNSKNKLKIPKLANPLNIKDQRIRMLNEICIYHGIRKNILVIFLQIAVYKSGKGHLFCKKSFVIMLKISQRKRNFYL